MFIHMCTVAAGTLTRGRPEVTDYLCITASKSTPTELLDPAVVLQLVARLVPQSVNPSTVYKASSFFVHDPVGFILSIICRQVLRLLLQTCRATVYASQHDHTCFCCSRLRFSRSRGVCIRLHSRRAAALIYVGCHMCL